MLNIARGANPLWLRALRHGVAATTEHIPVLKNIDQCNSVIDIGANKGQFTLVARYVFPKAKIISFEPLAGPAEKFRKVFKSDKNVILHEGAVGPKAKNVSMHVSERDDSSSLLRIGKNQTTIFPGTEEKHTVDIKVGPLSHFLSKEDIVKPVFVKIDVQGYELEVLIGCGDFLENFDYIYIECSFVELYEGQALADEVIEFLRHYSIKLKGIYNVFYDNKGLAIQGDFLFVK